jgi:hypothetical protein
MSRRGMSYIEMNFREIGRNFMGRIDLRRLTRWRALVNILLNFRVMNCCVILEYEQEWRLLGCYAVWLL